MKKLICILLTVLLLAAAPTAAFAEIDNSVDNLLNYLFEKNVDPILFDAIFNSFVSFETADSETGFQLRTESNEDIADEIQMLSSRFNTNITEIAACVDAFVLHFGDKPREFELFISYVRNTGNIILPLYNQGEVMSSCINISDYVLREFYGSTYAFNLLASIDGGYLEEKGTHMLLLRDEYLTMQPDVAETIQCLENSDDSIANFAVEKLTALVDFISGGDNDERESFNQFLTSAGLVSIDANDLPDEPEEDAITSLYESLKAAYAGGNDYISEFSDYKAVADKYSAQIKNLSADERSAKISEALAAAAEVKLINNVSSDSVGTIINDSQFFTFAVLNAMMTKKLLTDDGISIPQDQKFFIPMTYRETDFPEGYTLRIPVDCFNVVDKYNVTEMIICSPHGDIAISVKGISESGLLEDSAHFTVALRYGDAADIIPSLEAYAQGSPVLSLSFSGTSKINDFIRRDVMYYGKDVSMDEGIFTDNNFYSVNSDKTREHVSDYIYSNDYITFEIGDSRNIVYVEGELKEPVQTTKPSGGTVLVNPDDDKDVTLDKEDETDKTDNTGDGDKKPVTVDVKFNDVPDSHWAKDYIIALAASGVVSGTGNDNFEPDASVTREQFTKIVLGALNLYIPGTTSKFTDVDSDAWYAPYVACAAETGIVNGIGEGLFGIGGFITRQDMAVMVVRAAKAAGITLPSPSTHEYNDYRLVADYALDSMLILSSADVITGFEDNTLRGDALATRAQAAKIIYTLLQLSKD